MKPGQTRLQPAGHAYGPMHFTVACDVSACYNNSSLTWTTTGGGSYTDTGRATIAISPTAALGTNRPPISWPAVPPPRLWEARKLTPSRTSFAVRGTKTNSLRIGGSTIWDSISGQCIV